MTERLVCGECDRPTGAAPGVNGTEVTNRVAVYQPAESGLCGQSPTIENRTVRAAGDQSGAGQRELIEAM